MARDNNMSKLSRWLECVREGEDVQAHNRAEEISGMVLPVTSAYKV